MDCAMYRKGSVVKNERQDDGCRVRDDLRVNGYYNFDYEINRLMEKLK